MSTTETATMRPIMTRAELSTYRLSSDAVVDEFASHGGDGYDRMEVAASHGWIAASGWGLEGWDLGDWPYVIVFVRNRGGQFQLSTNVEGDVDFYSFPRQEERHAAIDYLFLWYGMGRNYDDWVASGLNPDKRDVLDRGELRIPERFRGPFSWERLNEHERGMRARALITEAVRRAKAEIMADIDSGRVPADLPSFSALHDHVDANEYGGLCEDHWFEGDENGHVAAAADVQEQLDAWIKGGRV